MVKVGVTSLLLSSPRPPATIYHKLLAGGFIKLKFVDMVLGVYNPLGACFAP